MTKRRLSELGRQSLRDIFGDRNGPPPKIVDDLPRKSRSFGEDLRPASTPKMVSPISKSGGDSNVRSIASIQSMGRRKTPRELYGTYH